MKNYENTNEWINWIEEAIDKQHIKYYEYENFKNIQEIGSGAFGKVFRANWKNVQHHLVLKSFFNLNNITVKEIVNEVILFFFKCLFCVYSLVRFYFFFLILILFYFFILV